MRKFKRIIRGFATAAAAFALIQSQAPVVQAAGLTSGSLALSDSRPAQTGVTYTLNLSSVQTVVTKCVAVTFSQSADGSGAIPSNMSLAGASLNASSNYVAGINGWTKAVVGKLITYSDATGGTPAGSGNGRTIVINGVTNSDTANGGTPYYAIVNTFSTSDCSTTPLDSAVVAYDITAGTIVSVTVDPTLQFVVSAGPASCNGANVSSGATSSGTAVGLGHVGVGANAIGDQYLAVTANATNGYTVFAHDTGQLASNNGAGPALIADLGGATNGAPISFTAPGTESFGYTSDDSTLSVVGNGANRFTNSGPNWAAMTTTDAEVMYSSAGPATGVGSDQHCIAYQVGAGGSTKASSYSTTVIYIAVPVF